MLVEIYSDVVCPWCYIGERRFARALAASPEGGEDVEIVFRPYQLDPTAPERAEPLLPHLERKYGRSASGMQAQAAAAAASEGITMDFARALAVNTRTAHRALQLALAVHGPAVQHALAERSFAAYFTEGADVSDVDLLARLASEVGMDAARVRAHLASGAGAAELDAALTEARALGIQAVPTFVFDGRYAVQGAQPPETFAEVLAEVRLRSADDLDDVGG